MHISHSNLPGSLNQNPAYLKYNLWTWSDLLIGVPMLYCHWKTFFWVPKCVRVFVTSTKSPGPTKIWRVDASESPAYRHEQSFQILVKMPLIGSKLISGSVTPRRCVFIHKWLCYTLYSTTLFKDITVLKTSAQWFCICSHFVPIIEVIQSKEHKRPIHVLFGWFGIDSVKQGSSNQN